MNDMLFIARFPKECTYGTAWLLYGWYRVKLMPSPRVLSSPCAMSRHFMQSHILKVYVCLAVTCHLHLWQNDRDLVRATAVTRGWNGYQNESAQTVDPGAENYTTHLAGIRTRDLSVTCPAL